MSRTDPLMRPVVGVCVETADGKRRTVVATRDVGGGDCDPRKLGELRGYNILYRRNRSDKVNTCWLGTWQEWCSRNKAVVVDAAG